MINTERIYHKITDEQWKIIEPHLPKPKSTGRPGINPRTAFFGCWIQEQNGDICRSFRKWIVWGVNQNNEVSRGGKTTKIHALVNENFQLVGISLSKVTLEGKKILSDKGYCSDFFKVSKTIDPLQHVTTNCQIVF